MTVSALQNIIAGPSRQELFLALELQDEKRRVVFGLTNRPHPSNTRFKVIDEEMSLTVHGISVEDGSGNNWLLKLFDHERSKHYKAYYNSQRRAGWIAPKSNNN